MGILDSLRSQFLEVIEWLDESSNTLVYRFPVKGQEIKNGAQLTVRESQAAAFVYQGEVADVFSPGLYTIDGGNTPILTKLGAWMHGFNSPFKSEVYFVSTRQFTDLKWGTSNPVMMRDTDFGMVRLRAFGIYSIRVTDPRALIREVAGTNAHFVTDDIEGQLKRMLVSGLSDALGESKIAALDLASNYEELSKFVRNKINDEFTIYGIALTKFVIENISLPPEVEAAMDRRTSMGVIGDVVRYSQFQAADAMRDAAQNPGGGAGTGAGLGAGFAIGNAMAGAITNSLNQQKNEARSEEVKCPKCGAANPAGVKFCHECGGTMAHSQNVPCINCGANLQIGSKFCVECGTSQQKQRCSNCQTELTAGAKFCTECGQKTDG